MGPHARNGISVRPSCYTLCMLYAGRGISKVRNESWLIDLDGEDNVSRFGCAYIPSYKLDLLVYHNMCNDCIVNLQINVNKVFHQ